jgi:hypothetical protein
MQRRSKLLVNKSLEQQAFPMSLQRETNVGKLGKNPSSPFDSLLFFLSFVKAATDHGPLGNNLVTRLQWRLAWQRN